MVLPSSGKSDIRDKIIRKFVFIVDIWISSIIAVFLVIFVIFFFFISKLISRSQIKSNRRILFMFTLGVYEDLQKKGISHMILERDENGYFDHVYNIHLFARKDQLIKLTERHTLVEFGGYCNALKTSGFMYLSVILTCLYSIPIIYKIIISENRCVLRATDPYIDGLIVYLLGIITGTPYCVSLHADYDKIYEISSESTPMFFGSKKLTKLLGRFVLSHTPMVLPISNYLTQFAIHNGANPESIRIIPHGVNILKFQEEPDVQFRKKLGLDGRKLIVYAGRLSKEKYIYDIFKSAKKIANKYPNAIFLIIGDGPEKNALFKIIQKYNLEKNVIMMGFLPNDTVIKIESIADINLCLLAGFSLIEAGLSGNPVIAYDVEWHSELITNGESGLIIKEGDIDSLTNSIILLLNNPYLSKKMGDAMKALVTQRHSLEITSKIKINCYNEIFQSKL
jgi:glycosyltransferase involved in cell wall biosynthesis